MLVAVVVGAGGLAAWALLGGGDEPAGEDDAAALPDVTTATVTLESFAAPGVDPFTVSVDVEQDEPYVVELASRGTPLPALSETEAALRAEPAEALEVRDGQLWIDGATPGLYGGTRDERTCDVDQLGAFLAADPSLAAAWASVPGIEPSAIPTYLDDLTEARLAADTRVRNHGYRDGAATPQEAVLQRGTAVLVDDRGVPRVRCACGNPLSEPQLVPAQVDRGSASTVGESWPGYREDAVVVVRPAPEPVDALELTDVRDGQRFERPAGAGLGADRDAPSTSGRQAADASASTGEAPTAGGSGDSICGVVVRPSDGAELAVTLLSDELGCDTALATADELLMAGSDREQVIGDFQCLPNLPDAPPDIIVVCESVAGSFALTSAGPPPEPPEEAAPGDAAPEDAAPATPSDVEVACGQTDPPVVDNVTFDAFEVVVLPGNPITCDEAVSIGEELLLGLATWALTDGVPISGTALYADEIRGWFCRVPSGLLDGTETTIGCESPGGVFELRAP